MKSVFQLTAAILLTAAATSALAETYTFEGPLYEEAFGPYTTSMRVTGTIETSAPIPPNSPVADRSALITSFSFNDGVVTLNDSNALLCSITIGTDAAGVPIDGFMTINENPSGVGANAMDLGIGPYPGAPASSQTLVGTFIQNNAVCTTNSYDFGNNFARAEDGLTADAVVDPAEIPTLAPLGLLALGGGLAVAGLLGARRSRRTA